MQPLLRRRPSPALVISLIALFVSLSGVSYGVATGFIDSREIKNNEIRSLDIRNNEVRTRDLRNNEIRGIDIRNSTIQGRDIGLNQVTGEDVKEDTLQKVPSALLADTATSATSAQTAASADAVGGVSFRKFSYSAEQGSGFGEVLSVAGLTLTASCKAGPTIELRATTSVDNSGLRWQFPPDAPDGDGDFDAGGFVTLADTANERAGEIAFVASDGRVVLVNGLLRSELDVGGEDCTFLGVAQSG